MLKRLKTWWKERQAQQVIHEREEMREDALRTLLDPTKAHDAREEAATFLSAFDDPEVEQALVRVASDPATNAEVAERCGLSLGPIWSGKASIDIAILEQLQPAALQALASWLKGINGEWDVLFSDVLHLKALHHQK